jgi:transcriptional regulator with XRE-family HTH domain
VTDKLAVKTSKLLSKVSRQEGTVNGADQIKNLRNQLGFTMREVEEYSRRIAAAENNHEFAISTTRLCQIETDKEARAPNIYRLYSLSAIYGVSLHELLSYWGIDLENISKRQAELPRRETQKLELRIYDTDRTVSFPIQFDPVVDLNKSNLFSRVVQLWGEVPLALLQHLDLKYSIIGYVGLKDNSMYPILRPGSLVQIDERFNKIVKAPRQSEFERPIYFVDYREGYACSWCEVHGDSLFLVPHPLSGTELRQFRKSDVEVIGQVTAIATRVVARSFSGDQPASTPAAAHIREVPSPRAGGTLDVSLDIPRAEELS